MCLDRGSVRRIKERSMANQIFTQALQEETPGFVLHTQSLHHVERFHTSSSKLEKIDFSLAVPQEVRKRPRELVPLLAT